MERFPVELLYVLAFIGFVLFNIITQRAARRRRQEDQEAAAAPAPVEDEPLEDIWGRAPVPVPEPVPVVVQPLSPPPAPPPARIAAPPVRRRMHPVRALLKEPRDLRRAVVLMMVLGPCRAQQPAERD